MSKLLDFLTENTAEITDKVAVSERFRDPETGELLKFEIKAIPSNVYSELQRKHTKVGKKGKVDFNSDAFNMDLVIDYTIDPNFRDAKAIKKAGCTTPQQFVSKSLLAGEFSNLVEAIGEISGFNKGLEELREEAKN